jgi:putative hydrolase of the HAD superfamily
MLKAVLFDAAGTLFRVRGSVGHVYATVAARHGVSVAPQDIGPRFHAAFQQMPPLAFPDAPQDKLPQREYAWWTQVVATAFGGEHFADFDAFFRELFEYFADAAAWEVFPDVRPTLAALKARGLRLGLVSNFDGRLVSICNGLGIAGDFEVLVMSGRVGAAKPDPRIFEFALARLGVDAAETVHVGDSEREDVEGARAAGLRAILIQRAAPADRGSHAVQTYVVRDLRQVVDCV